MAVEDLEIRNREPSRRVRPRRDQRARDDVVDPVAIDRWRAAVVIAHGRGKAGLDPAAQTVLDGLRIGRDRRIAAESAGIDPEAERAIARKSTRLNSSPSCASRMPSAPCKQYYP